MLKWSMLVDLRLDASSIHSNIFAKRNASSRRGGVRDGVSEKSGSGLSESRLQALFDDVFEFRIIDDLLDL